MRETRQQRTRVIVRFEPPVEWSMRVTLRHPGRGDGGEWDRASVCVDRAWGSVLGNLNKRFDSATRDWTAWLEQLDKVHSTRTQLARRRYLGPQPATSPPRRAWR